MEYKWHILFCDDYLESCPVEEFIERCRKKHQAKILRFLSLLERKGPTLPRPYADLLFDGVHELRIRLSGDHLRLLYFFCYRKFIILYYAFVKTSDRVPEKFVRRVVKYREDFLSRNKPDDLEKKTR